MSETFLSTAQMYFLEEFAKLSLDSIAPPDMKTMEASDHEPLPRGAGSAPHSKACANVVLVSEQCSILNKYFEEEFAKVRHRMQNKEENVPPPHLAKTIFPTRSIENSTRRPRDSDDRAKISTRDNSYLLYTSEAYLFLNK